MENNIATPYSVAHYENYSEIQAINGSHVCFLKQESQGDRIAIGSFIVTACNNYQSIKADNTLLKEVNEAQIFTIEKYQKENEELTIQLAKANSDKEKTVALVKEMQQYIDLLFNEAILDDFSDIGRKGSNLYDQAHNLLTDCGITL